MSDFNSKNCRSNYHVGGMEIIMLYQKKYRTIAGIDCFNACLTSYYRYHGFKINEYDLYYIGEGYNEEYKMLPEGPHIFYSIFCSGHNFLRESGEKTVHDFFTDSTLAKDMLINNVLHEKNISIVVRSDYLKYSRTFNAAGNIGHLLNVIGFNSENNKILISDCYVPDVKTSSSFEGWLNFEDILIAWEGMRYEYYIFYPTAASEILCKNIDYYLLKYVKSYNYLKLEEFWTLSFEFLDDVFFSGDCVVIKDILYKLNYQLRVFGFLSDKIYFLQMLKHKFDNDPIIEKYQNIVSQWNILCLKLVKLSLTANLSLYDKIKNEIILLNITEINVRKWFIQHL